MSKIEILDELPKLTTEERREIVEKIRDLDGAILTQEEKAILDSELAEYESNPVAGSTWTEVESRIRRGAQQ